MTSASDRGCLGSRTIHTYHVLDVINDDIRGWLIGNPLAKDMGRAIGGRQREVIV